jgi:addiction module RelB/DinJ family antitoxin
MKTLINIKADKNVKEEAVKTATAMGLPLSTVVNAFLKQFISQQSITFTIPIKPTKWLQKILMDADKDFREDKNIAGPFHAAKDMTKSLRS